MESSNGEEYSIPRLEDYYISHRTGFMLEEPLVCVYNDLSTLLILFTLFIAAERYTLTGTWTFRTLDCSYRLGLFRVRIVQGTNSP